MPSSHARFLGSLGPGPRGQPPETGGMVGFLGGREVTSFWVCLSCRDERLLNEKGAWLPQPAGWPRQLSGQQASCQAAAPSRPGHFHQLLQLPAGLASHQPAAHQPPATPPPPPPSPSFHRWGGNEAISHWHHHACRVRGRRTGGREGPPCCCLPAWGWIRDG